jgi:4'-phosphopantetheinyl transferase
MTTPTAVRHPDAADLHGTAEVWLLPESTVDRLAAALDADRLLTTDERARRDRLLRPDSRRRFVGARLLSRHVLSHYAGLPPAAWQFATGPYGRPEIAGDNILDLDFNVSHTEGLITCVVSRHRRTGVDTERWPARPEAVRLAGRVLSDRERRWLDALPEPAQRRLFSGYWVLKEAYTKALGLGLQRRFDSFEVRDGPAGHPVPVDPLGGEGGRWQLHLLDVPPAHLVGVAMWRGPAEPVLPVRVRDAARELTPGAPPGPRLWTPPVHLPELGDLIRR